MAGQQQVNEDESEKRDSPPKKKKKAAGDRLLASRLWVGLNKNLYTDVKFILRDGKHIEAHKLVLIYSGSPVFMKLLGEEEYKACKEIFLPEISYEGFYEVLRFLYRGKVNLKDICTAANVYRVAKLFNLKALVASSLKYIKNYKVKTDEVFQVLEVAHYFGVTILEQNCFCLIAKKTELILDSNNFLSQDYNVVATICTMQKLTIKSELVLFTKILNWAYRKTQRKFVRKLLRPFLPHIRFLSMSAKELSTIQEQYPDFFSTEELLSLLIAVGSKKQDDLPSWCNKTKKSRSGPVENKVTLFSSASTKTAFKFVLIDKEVEINVLEREKMMQPRNLSCSVKMHCSATAIMFHGLILRWKDDPVYNGPSTESHLIAITSGSGKILRTHSSCVAKMITKCDFYTEIEVLLAVPVLLKKDEFWIEAVLNNIRGITFLQLQGADNVYRIPDQGLPFTLVACYASKDNSFFISSLLYEVCNDESSNQQPVRCDPVQSSFSSTNRRKTLSVNKKSIFSDGKKQKLLTDYSIISLKTEKDVAEDCKPNVSNNSPFLLQNKNNEFPMLKKEF